MKTSKIESFGNVFTAAVILTTMYLSLMPLV